MVSKCSVNRLRPLLQDIIFPSQSVFVPGSLITDNALIAFECIHAINSTTDERSSYCAYKLDLSKAYDRVDWSFLNNVLLKLGFQSNWVQRVMTCVTSVVCTLLSPLQWRHVGAFYSNERSSPRWSFVAISILFVAGGLSKLISRKVQEGPLEELRVCRGAPGISHLLLADDTLLFLKQIQTKPLKLKLFF